jgi:hypothetical protein
MRTAIVAAILSAVMVLLADRMLVLGVDQARAQVGTDRIIGYALANGDVLTVLAVRDNGVLRQCVGGQMLKGTAWQCVFLPSLPPR